MRLARIGTIAAALVALVGCSADSGTGSPGTTAGSTAAPATTIVRPEGPAAALAPLTGGNGTFLPSAGGPSLAEAGYTEAELSASGTATSYASDGALPPDGRYDLSPAGSAPYATRIVVRRPTDARRFNGTVAVEWLNVSGGLDSAPDYTYLADELLRSGSAWVGVSAQRIGIEGGEVAVRTPSAEARGAGRGLRAIDPERYGSLQHPGDAFAYDIYTQVARALRAPDAGALTGGPVERLLAVGESQSAMLLTTYRNGVQPLARQFDGFLIHSRFAASAPLGAPGAGIDIAGSIGGPPTKIRDDEPVPTLVVQTETDVLGLLGYLAARQPDDEHLRVWEVAGTAHADAYVVGDSDTAKDCAPPINRGQQSYVMKAALRHLDAWVRTGTAPPSAPTLAVDATGAAPAFVRDEVGNVQGGVRTPAVDAPVDVLSGLPGESASIVCILMGTTTPIPPERLATRYASPEAYVAEYTAAADEAIAAGFVLPEDREALLREADPARLAT